MGQRYNRGVPESRQVGGLLAQRLSPLRSGEGKSGKAFSAGRFTWQEVDVDSDTELRRQFNDEVPVVFIDGRKAFKYRMDEREFLRKLAS